MGRHSKPDDLEENKDLRSTEMECLSNMVQHMSASGIELLSEFSTGGNRVSIGIHPTPAAQIQFPRECLEGAKYIEKSINHFFDANNLRPISRLTAALEDDILLINLDDLRTALKREPAIAGKLADFGTEAFKRDTAETLPVPEGEGQENGAEQTLVLDRGIIEQSRSPAPTDSPHPATVEGRWRSLAQNPVTSRTIGTTDVNPPGRVR